MLCWVCFYLFENYQLMKLKSKIKNILYIFLSISVLILSSCRSVHHAEGFDLQNQSKDDFDTTGKQVYITSTLPIDSADVNKLIFDVWSIDIDDYPKEVRLKARVFDSSGHFITNMAKPYLKDSTKNYWTGVRETLGKSLNRPPVPIDSFTVREFGANDSIPYNLVLSVDYSGSMTSLMSTLFEGTEIFVNLKLKYDNIALTSFNKDYDVKVPLMNDKEKIINLYRTNRNRGVGLFSAVFDAVGNSINLLKDTPKNDPRVVVIFTDGDDNYSQEKLGNLIDSAKANKIHVFCVAFGYSQDNNLREIAKNTGGKFYKAYTKEELIAIFRDIYMSLRYHYSISYKPPKFWGYHKVRVAVNVPKRSDTLYAYGEYDTSNKYNWDSTGGVFELPILFDFDSSSIKPESFYIIDEIADQMLSNPRLKLEIQGHTDNKGTIEYNQVLSDKRASIVMESIINKGVERKRLRARGFGFSVPKLPNTTDENRSKNRRTEFHVLAR